MREEQITATQLHQMELREERRELANLDALVASAMAQVDPGMEPAQRAALETLLRDLLETKRKYLDALIADSETYFQKLVDFDAKQLELIEKTEELLRFIDERILWIPSGAAMRPGLLADAREALAWLVDARYWGQLLRALVDALAGAPFASASVALLLALAGFLLPRARRRVRALGAEASAPLCTRFAPTLEALAWTGLLAPWLPGLFAYLGQAVAASPEATLFTRCLAGGTLAASLVWLALEVPRQVLRRGGLAEAHFGWPADAVRGLRRDLGALTALAVPCVLVIQTLELRGEDRWKESLGRALLVLLLGVLAVLAQRWLRRPDGALARIADAALERALPAWRWRGAHALAVAVPVLLGGAALAGYYWTALHLGWRYHLTLCFLFALAVTVRLFARGSLVARRRLALEQAEARRAELAAASAARANDAGAPPAEEEGALDLAAVGAQTSRLLHGAAFVAMLSGLWLIWADVLPAAGILREVELWTTTQRVTVEVQSAAGERRFEAEQRVLPVTLADLLQAALIALASLVLIRNLPGALEISLFRRLGLPPGERYAYATLAKYGVGVAGIALAADAIGIGWSSVQWLVAAVGIGLGFGLQEIFANFVSGLILLFERPIRVGDTVTIGDLSGTVARIRIRATWLIGADRKDIVVPNKEFVTGRLVNWTLTDPVLRVELVVGVAYGSDVARALALLERVALENSRVMRTPAPQASFQRFGESSLELVLRCFSPDGANEGPIRHELHLAIERLFREQGIEIAFPQRDVHLRTLPPGWSPPRG
jgi:potassium efflux system protein